MSIQRYISEVLLLGQNSVSQKTQEIKSIYFSTKGKLCSMIPDEKSHFTPLPHTFGNLLIPYSSLPNHSRRQLFYPS